MLNFKHNIFFVKFAVLFFLITLFGYWGIDLNAEEVYIAFSFFFLVVFAFIVLRLSILSLFAGLVNRRYSRIVQEGIFTAYIAKVVGVFWRFPFVIISFVIQTYGFFISEVVTLFSLRAGLLINWSAVCSFALRSILGIMINFFTASVLRFSGRLTFSSVLTKVFVLEV